MVTISNLVRIPTIKSSIPIRSKLPVADLGNRYFPLTTTSPGTLYIVEKCGYDHAVDAHELHLLHIKIDRQTIHRRPRSDRPGSSIVVAPFTLSKRGSCLA